LGRPHALPANIRPGWRGLPGTNTLAYYENPSITAVKFFIVQAPGNGNAASTTSITTPRIMTLSATQRNSSQQCDAQQNGTQPSDTHHKDIQHTDTQRDDSKHDNVKLRHSA
jgi:hypothetical protein